MSSRTCPEIARMLPGIAAIMLLALSVAIRAQDRPADPAHAEHAHVATPVDRAGKRWATDAPLRDGMRRVRQAVQALDHSLHGHPSAAQTANAGSQIEGAVNGMIANCKLDPDADAALHGLLAKFLVGANAAHTGQGLPAALADMQAALKQYPELFDDPTWNAPAN